MDIEKFFKAKSVAIVGVSKDPKKVGHVIFRNLLDANFRGDLYLVNPNAYEILNRQVYKSLNEIRTEIDLVVIAVPAKKVLDIIKDCGKKKIKNVVVISSGFKEIGNEKLEIQLKELVDKFKINMIGVNCVSGGTPLLITNDDHNKFYGIGDLVDSYMNKYKENVIKVLDTYILDTEYIDKNLKIASFNYNEHCFNKIKKLMKRINCMDAYKVKLAGGRELICSRDHPFIIKKDNSWTKIPLKELNIGDEVPITVALPQSDNFIREINLLDYLHKIPKKFRNKLRFYYNKKAYSLKEIKNFNYENLKETRLITVGKVSLPVVLPITRELCELLGYYIADGNYEEKCCVIGYISDPNAELKLRSHINGIFNSRLSNNTKNKIKFGGFVGKLVFRYIFEIGSGVENKIIPQFIFSAEHDKIANFLGGFYDGDGGIYIFKDNQKASIYLDSVSIKLKEQAMTLLGILNVGPFYVTKIKKEGKKGVFKNAQDSYEIRSDSKQAINDLYNKGFRFLGAKNLRLNKVIETRRSFGRRIKDKILLRKIKSIEKINEPINLYDLEVEDSHNFFAGQILTSNCLGVFDAYTKLDTLFLPRYRLKRPNPGGISFISQSGAIGSAILDLATAENYGIAKFVSYGNATTIDESDILEYLGNDKETKVICMYLEGIRNGKKFIEIAKKVSRIKPIIAIKGGLTEEGNKATLSHTGSLAGTEEVYYGAFRQCNIIIANSLHEMFNYAKILEKSIIPKGNKIQIITNGGGYGILCTDAVVKNNLKLAELGKDTFSKLKKLMHELVIVGNPMDLIGDATTERYQIAIENCLNDKNVDILLVNLLYQTPLISTDVIDIITELNDLKKKPIIVVSTGGEFTELLKKNLEENNIPCYTFPEEAVTSIKALTDYYLKKINLNTK